jgi:RNA polymerase sigma factor (sigma-70 family)
VDKTSSYSRLIGPIEDQMLGTVWRVLRNAHDAEDALHSALAILWEQWPRIESHPNPHALILKVCADAAIDHLRRRRHRAGHQNLESLARSLPASQAVPADDAIRNETMEEITAAVARLPDHQAVAVAMRFFKERLTRASPPRWGAPRPRAARTSHAAGKNSVSYCDTSTPVPFRRKRHES